MRGVAAVQSDLALSAQARWAPDRLARGGLAARADPAVRGVQAGREGRAVQVGPVVRGGPGVQWAQDGLVRAADQLQPARRRSFSSCQVRRRILDEHARGDSRIPMEGLSSPLSLPPGRAEAIQVAGEHRRRLLAAAIPAAGRPPR